MRNFIRLLILSLSFSVLGAYAQTALVATTLAATIGSSNTTLKVASGTGITTQTALLIDHEVFEVTTVSGTFVGVVRGGSGTVATGHKSGAMVLIGNPTAFLSYDPAGTCTNGSGLWQYSPIVNTRNGNQWICSTVTGTVVAGFGNRSVYPGPSTAVASAAGLITPSGPLFHVTGALAITGFNIPVGFDPGAGGGFCIIPDGTFTTTNANNIAIASTAVVSKTLCYTYDPNSAKFTPSY